MKRLLVYLLVICTFMFNSGYVICADNSITNSSDKVLLSSLGEEECIEFLSEYGITLPEELSDMDILGFVAALEENPDMVVEAINWDILREFSMAVRDAVREYYALEPVYSLRSLNYTLVNSTLYSWDSATMPFYNCYGYALGFTNECQPGRFSNSSYDQDASIMALASVISNDLKGVLMQSCVKIQIIYPSSTSEWDNILAIRKDTNYDYWEMNDYHVATLDGSSWYHKPGSTAVLKFNYAPTNSVVWSNEGYNGSYYEPFVWYDSDIVYISYKTLHSAAINTWTGEHYHSGSEHYFLYAEKCPDCGEFLDTSTRWVSMPCSGPPCATPWVLN